MKRFFKCFSCYMVALLLVASCVLFPALGASAAEGDLLLTIWNSLSQYNYMTDPFNEVTNSVSLYSDRLTVYSLVQNGGSVLTYPPGDYIFYELYNGWKSTSVARPFEICVVTWVEEPADMFTYYSFGDVVHVDEGQEIYIQSFGVPSFEVVETAPPAPLYQSAWDLFVSFVYGENAELTPDQTLTLTLLSTLAVLLLVALPFLIIFGVIKGLFG